MTIRVVKTSESVLQHRIRPKRQWRKKGFPNCLILPDDEFYAKAMRYCNRARIATSANLMVDLTMLVVCPSKLIAIHNPPLYAKSNR